MVLNCVYSINTPRFSSLAFIPANTEFDIPAKVIFAEGKAAGAATAKPSMFSLGNEGDVFFNTVFLGHSSELAQTEKKMTTDGRFIPFMLVEYVSRLLNNQTGLTVPSTDGTPSLTNTLKDLQFPSKTFQFMLDSSKQMIGPRTHKESQRVHYTFQAIDDDPQLPPPPTSGPGNSPVGGPREPVLT